MALRHPVKTHNVRMRASRKAWLRGHDHSSPYSHACERIGLDHRVWPLGLDDGPRQSGPRPREGLKLARSRHPSPSRYTGEGCQKEVAVGTVIQYTQRGNDERNQRWNRVERAERFAQYGDLQAQGLSQRQAAKALDVPRSTLQCGRTKSASMRVLRSSRFFTASLVLPSCIDWSWRYTWSLLGGCLWDSPGVSTIADNGPQSVCRCFLRDAAAGQPSC